MKIFGSESLGRKRSWDYEGDATPEDDGIKPLIETDKGIDISEPIIINNIAYSLGSIRFESMSKGGLPIWGIADKLDIQDVFVKNEEPEEQQFTSNIVCPYCGYENQDSWECSDDEDEEICGNCGSTFSYERIVTVEYTSYPVKKAECVRLEGSNE